MKRTFAIWAAVLAIGALASGPQIWQHLRADAKSNLVGAWTIDGEATWDELRKNPQIAKQLAGLQPAEVEPFKYRTLIKIAVPLYEFTTDQMYWIKNGVNHEMGYRITAVNGNVLTAACIDNKANVIQMKFTVIGDRLEVFKTATPDTVLIFDRVH